jgi:outer membrane protein W
MTMSTLPKLAALSLVLSSPVALADNEGVLRLQDDAPSDGYEDSTTNDSTSSEVGPGFALGVRAGFGLPLGNAVGEDEDGGEAQPLSDTVSAVIPLQLDLGYFINSNLYVGGSFQYGYGILNDEEGVCDTDGVSCNVSQMRFGLNLAYHFAPAAKMNPWVGVGVGYETLTLGASAEEDGVEAEITSTAKGFEFINAQGGLDFRLSDTISVGPFVTFTVAQYSSTSSRVELDGESEEDSADIENTAIHSWLYGGVKLQARF